MTDPNLTLLLVSSSTGGTINYTPYHAILELFR